VCNKLQQQAFSNKGNSIAMLNIIFYIKVNTSPINLFIFKGKKIKSDFKSTNGT
jgi:hypothetical protein